LPPPPPPPPLFPSHEGHFFFSCDSSSSSISLLFLLKTDCLNYVHVFVAPQVEFVEDVPRTVSGKIKRKELKMREWAKDK